MLSILSKHLSLTLKEWYGTDMVRIQFISPTHHVYPTMGSCLSGDAYFSPLAVEEAERPRSFRWLKCGVMNPANTSVQVSGLSFTHTITEPKLLVPISKIHSIKEACLLLHVTVEPTGNKNQQLFPAGARQYMRLSQKGPEKPKSVCILVLT